jgi:hypothetical protein
MARGRRNRTRIKLACLGLAALFMIGTGRGAAQGTEVQAGQAPAGQPATPFRGKLVTYKFKLSEGSAWTNTKPESWLTFEVSDGTTVTVHHSTMVLNMITSMSRWWEHPILASRACQIGVGEGGKRLQGCLTGSNTGTGQATRHQLQLPEDTSIHDYMFEIQWLENSVTQKALIRISSDTKPVSIQPLSRP